MVKSLVVAGLSGGSGKSVVSVGLTAALTKEGNRVIPFKKGPDYIDAGWLTTAAGNPCYNLDPFLMSPAVIRETFNNQLGDCSFAVIEGNRGIFDGVNPEGSYSTAELALLLDLPVLLVINCSKTTRTVAAMVLGCCQFDSRVRFAGVILNEIATPRHESIIRQAIEKYTPVSVLGIVPRMKDDVFPMRHLGVTPHQEYKAPDRVVDTLATLAHDNFDLDRIIDSMATVTPSPQPAQSSFAAVTPQVTIGVLRDMAFQFYYQENLESLQAAGADLVMIDALTADQLPAGLDGLYIGGGFPETSVQQLAENARFRHSVRSHAEAGLPIYAECGGLIFLGRSLVTGGVEYPLVNVFPVTFGISEKPQAHGYSSFTVEQENAFYPIGTQIKGHEFRYSTVENWDGEAGELACTMERGTGFFAGRDGLVSNNVLALYTHVMASGTPQWVEGFIQAARRHHSKKG